MDITEVDHNTYLVLAPRGKLNLTAAPPLRARIDDLVRTGRAKLIVDLAGVDFIDSSGLGALVGGLKAARAADPPGDLRLANAGEQVLAVLKLTNLDRILTPARSVAKAAHGW